MLLLLFSSKENLFKYQHFIFGDYFLILMTGCMFDEVVILQGEIECLSLLGRKGFNFPGCIRKNKARETGNTPILVEELKLTVVKVLKNQHLF